MNTIPRLDPATATPETIAAAAIDVLDIMRDGQTIDDPVAIPDNDTVRTVVDGVWYLKSGTLTQYRNVPKRITGTDRDLVNAFNARKDFHTGRNVNLHRTMFAAMVFDSDTVDALDTLYYVLRLITDGQVPTSVGAARWHHAFHG